MYDKVIIFTSLIYSVWVFYFCKQLMEEKFSPLKTYLLILLLYIVIVIVGRKIFSVGIPTILVQLTNILSIVLFHYGSIRKKLLAYVLCSCIFALVEMFVMSLYVSMQKLFFHSSKTYISMNSVTSSTDLVIMFSIMLTVGTLMFKSLSDLAGIFIRYYSIKFFAQIFFPIYWFFIIFSIFYDYLVKSKLRFIIFLTLSLPIVTIFVRGLKNVQIQERNRVLRKKQIELLKDQLEFFDAITDEYQNLRKWNHDIENHLLSMNYLMKIGKHEEAVKYLHNISE